MDIGDGTKSPSVASLWVPRSKPSLGAIRLSVPLSTQWRAPAVFSPHYESPSLRNKTKPQQNNTAMYIQRRNISHLIDTDWIPFRTGILTGLIKQMLLKCDAQEEYDPGWNLDKMQIRSYGTLQVWELALPEDVDHDEQCFWTFFLFTQEDLSEEFGQQIMEFLSADRLRLDPEDFDGFASGSGRQDLYVFPCAARRLAKIIPPLANFSGFRLN
jgi:hypothetical protein